MMSLALAVSLAWAKPFQIDENTYKDLSKIPEVALDIRYATENNFTHTNLYQDFKKAYLHKVAFEKLQMAAEKLKQRAPGFKFLVFDALRPRRVQKILFAKVKGTKQEQYVADPETGSVHNYGFALDLSLLNEKGEELDMGTPYDDFTDLAQPKLEDQFFKQGRLTSEQLRHRKLLREVMESSGFKVLEHEWWHFDALPLNTIKKKYQIVE